MAKRKTLPKDFKEICERGEITELEEVFTKCELNAYTGYSKQTAFSEFGIPENFICWLVEQGADINAGDTDQCIALHHHARYWKSEAKALLKYGASVDKVNQEGETPLFNAVTFGRVEVVELLLQHGAKIDVKNNIGHTPLEKGLLQCSNAGIAEMSEVAEQLLKNNAQKTSEMSEYVEKIGKNFEFYRSSFNPDYLEETERALDKLYQLFDVIPVPKKRVHDGVSTIEIRSTTWQKQHQELWELLVPGSGACQTVQGEVIRISGRISDEIFRNGGGNWDRHYKRMTRALGDYFRMGHSFDELHLNEAEEIIQQVIRQEGDEKLARLSELAVQWVMLNTKPITLEKTNYNR